MVAVGVLALLTACSGNGDAEPAESTTTVAPVPSSSAVPTATSAPTTTQAPTTTIDPAITLAEEVEADFLEAYWLEVEALKDPFNVEKESAAVERRVGFAADTLTARLAERREQNHVIRDNPAVSGSITVEVPATLVLEGADVAELEVCEVDPWILVEVGAGPNGSDAIVNDEVLSYRSTYFVRNVEGVWRIEGWNEVGRWIGATACPAR